MMIKYSSVWFMLFLSCSSCWRFLPTCRGAALDDEQQEQRQQQQEDEDDYIPPYDDYPDYCSTKDQIESSRNIPPLRDDVPVGETRLIHVAVITRHGARTPLIEEDQDDIDGGGFCWKGYMDREADTSVWDCTMTTWMGTPPVQAIQEKQGITPQVPFDDSLLWIDKRYDAFTASSSSSSKSSNNNLSNSLNGTCQMGQLLTGGYHQQRDIGHLLRKAYLYPPDTTQEGYRHHDERMRLTSEIFQNSKLSFRVDDVQRTILSGQALLQGLFGTPLIQGNLQETVIPMTMVDYSRDVFGLYQEGCPRLQELNQQAVTSPEFLALQQSSEARLWTKFMQTYFGRIPRSTIDCLMTTLCSDKTLPPAIDDFVTPTGRRRRQRRMETSSSNTTNNTITMATNTTSTTTPTRAPTTSTLPLTTAAAPTSSPIMSSSSSSEWDDDYGRDRFRRLVDFSTKNTSFPFTWQDAIISKLAMGPLWTHLLQNIKAATKSETIDDTSYPKLALVSSHDSTIWALLASLGMNSLLDHAPPYASMLLLEIHEIIGGSRNTSMFASNFALRMVYNGKVVTPLLPGCSTTNSDLCDLQVLTKLVEPFATTRQRNCNATKTAAATTTMAGSGGGSSSSSNNNKDKNGAGAPAAPALNTVSGLSNQDIQETRDAFRSPVGIFGLTLLAIVSFGFGSLITFCILSKQRRYDTF